MKISKKSWHYRFLNLAKKLNLISWIPNNLCEYFWKVVGLILASPGLLILALILFPLAILAYIGNYIFEFVADEYLDWKCSKPVESKEYKKNLFVSYYKATKEKLCPLIQFED